MPYLTLKEYENMNLTTVDDDDKLLQFIEKASAVLDNLTRNFYVFHDLETDVDFRKNKFKQAVACQVVYFIENDSSTSQGVQNTPKSISVGRTSLSYSDSSNSSNGTDGLRVVCEDVYIYLESTGLLYRGVPYV